MRCWQELKPVLCMNGRVCHDCGIGCCHLILNGWKCSELESGGQIYSSAFIVVFDFFQHLLRSLNWFLNVGYGMGRLDFWLLEILKLKETIVSAINECNWLKRKLLCCCCYIYKGQTLSITSYCCCWRTYSIDKLDLQCWKSLRIIGQTC